MLPRSNGRLTRTATNLLAGSASTPPSCSVSVFRASPSSSTSCRGGGPSCSIPRYGQSPASGPSSATRTLSTSSRACLPRQLPRKQLAAEQDTHTESAQHNTSYVSNISDELSGTDPAIPWFLQTETVDLPATETLPSSSDPASSSDIDLDDPKRFSYIPQQPKVEIPAAISNLKAHLVSGPSTNLVARANSEENELDMPTPITLIHPASLSKDPSSDAFGTNDWIVVVQVRSSSAGSVRRVALDIGKFLKHTPPPAMEQQDRLDLDDFLGPGPSAPRYSKDAATTTATKKTESKPQLGPRPKGMSRIEHELGKSLPDWAVHRIAMQRKFPDGWRPPKLLSREAQEGIRLLHASDPEQFDTVELAARFRVSKESIRRIIKAGDRPISGEMRTRQDRRASERVQERELAELEEIRRLQQEDGALVDDGESPEIEGFEDEMRLEEEEEDDGVPGIQPVRYEGLVMSASDAASTGVTSKTKAGGKKGDGNWCLVDAEWCMVHVMTEQARFNYDIEGMWRELEVSTKVKPKPWEEQEALLAATPTLTYKPRLRNKRDVFGDRISKKNHALVAQRRLQSPQSRSQTQTQSQSPSKFGDGRRGFSTSVLRGTRSAGTQLPETLGQTLARAQSAFESGSTDPISVTVRAWLRSTRKQKSVIFLEVSDGTLQGSRALQAVVKSSKDSSGVEMDRVAGLTVGSAVSLSGQLRPGRGSKKGQEVELAVEHIDVISGCDLTYPIAAATMQQQSTAVEEGGYSASLAERRNPHLLGRLPRYAAVLRTRQRLEEGMAAYFSGNQFVKVACPILTSSDCEGAGEVFQVGADTDVRAAQPLSSFWSGSPAYLTVSSQLHLEAVGLGLARTWTLNPAFRAEGSATNRHLAEFWMLEAEAYFVGLDEILHVAEDSIKGGIRNALAAEEDLQILGDQTHVAALQNVLQQPWRRITYDEAHQLLASAPEGTFANPPSAKDGLGSEHEKHLASKLGPVFVTHYPTSQKAFYMKRAEQEGRVECFDLLIPGIGELVGGSVREHRPDMLSKTLDEFAINQATREKLGWYIEDLKKFGGAVPHAGFGLGLERLTAWITNTEHVKDVVPFPRTKGPVRF
ncbi:asparaginyl-tRNA synthetase [Testicularia cyperi]|uniref:asparagine--tRNA ligase n=1 Tax=Testicularia cyperi TaxID=1882483 RepID=A0A317XL85_9BASI|nr:asparaginyl-tRNA synthetase [Testicularia cyperi]